MRVRIPVGGAAGEFSSPELTLCADSYLVSVPPPCYQWQVKDPDHSAKSAGGRLHLNTHTSLTQQSQSGPTMLLSGHSVGTYQETSSHTTHQGTLSHSHLSLLSRCGLILAKRLESVCMSLFPLQKQKMQAGNEWSDILPQSSHARKKPPMLLSQTYTRFEKFCSYFFNSFRH